MYCIFDTETTGLLIPSYPQDHPNQARIAQVGAILLDEEFKERASYYSLVTLPDYVIFNEGAARHNGLSKELCNKHGVPVELAILNLEAMFTKSKMQIGHNIDFDKSMLALEETILFGGPRLLYGELFCTMQSMTNICQIVAVRKVGHNKFKWPKLKEAFKHCFGTEYDKAHDALADVRATAAIFKWMHDNGHINKIVPFKSSNDELIDSNAAVES